LASLSELTRAQAERVAGLLAKQGEVQSAQVGRVAEDMVRRTQKNREILTRLVQREVKRQLGVLGMATRDEVARLQQRVRALEQEVERASQAPPSRARRSSSAGSGTARTTRSSTRTSKAKAAGSGAAKPSTRTRTGGASSRSTASSPGTRRPRGAAGSGSPQSPPT
jgi:polyhydroxyalkanoate synthesis regulator phasin